MPSTAENVAQDFQVSRADQDALRRAKPGEGRARRRPMAGSPRRSFPVSIPQRKGDPVVVDRDEHPRATTIEALAKLRPIVRPDGTVTAGNASGVNDGAAAMIVASRGRRRSATA